MCVMPAGKQEQFPKAATHLPGMSCHWAPRKDKHRLSPREHWILAWLLNNIFPQPNQGWEAPTPQAVAFLHTRL